MDGSLPKSSSGVVPTGVVPPAADATPTVSHAPPPSSVEPGEVATRPEQSATPGPAPVLPGKVGPYEVIELVARGGMGVVFKAHDTRLERVVALKMVRHEYGGSPDNQRRFLVEARAAARLRHPNIVQVYELNEHEGQPYFVMNFVGGGALSEHRERLSGDPRQAVALVEKVARAVQYAHEQGVIHRDLKPGNVLLDESGEPKISDFGLAKLRDAAADLTRTGAVLGTPSYMAPEQAAGRTDQFGPETDVWALGVILYELLTGRRPFLAAGEALPQQIRTEEPPRPRELRPSLDRGLEAVVLRCLEKDPARRYRSAGALADELGRWLRGEPLQTATEGLVKRLRRAARRHFQAGVAAGVVLAGLGALAFQYFTNPERARERAERRLRKYLPATLIGETGPPRWYRWRLSEGSVLGKKEADEPFRFAAWDNAAVVELLPDPQLEQYRFRVEVRHIHGDVLSEIGLAFGLKQKEFKELLYAFTFNDAAVIPLPGVPGAGVGNVQELSLRTGNSAPPSNLSKFIFRAVRFVPASANQNPWRQLVLEMKPERTKIVWDGETLMNVPRELPERKPGDDGPALALSPSDLQNLPEPFPGLGPTLREMLPRGGIGLYVRAGEAAFRNAVVEPLEVNSSGREKGR